MWMYSGVIKVKYSAGWPWARSWKPLRLPGFVHASQTEQTWTITLVGVWMNCAKVRSPWKMALALDWAPRAMPVMSSHGCKGHRFRPGLGCLQRWEWHPPLTSPAMVGGRGSRDCQQPWPSRPSVVVRWSWALVESNHMPTKPLKRVLEPLGPWRRQGCVLLVVVPFAHPFDVLRCCRDLTQGA